MRLEDNDPVITRQNRGDGQAERIWRIRADHIQKAHQGSKVAGCHEPGGAMESPIEVNEPHYPKSSSEGDR